MSMHCFIITILCAARKPVTLAPHTALAFLAAILRLATAPALGEFTRIRLPTTAEHYDKVSKNK